MGSRPVQLNFAALDTVHILAAYKHLSRDRLLGECSSRRQDTGLQKDCLLGGGFLDGYQITLHSKLDPRTPKIITGSPRSGLAWTNNLSIAHAQLALYCTLARGKCVPGPYLHAAPHSSPTHRPPRNPHGQPSIPRNRTFRCEKEGKKK